MTRLPLTICLALTWFFAVDALLSVAVTAATASWRGRRRGSVAGEASIPGSVALAMRLFPSVAALIFVAGVFVPAFELYEPAGGPEDVGWVVRATAAAACILALSAVGRGLTAVRRTRALVNRWLSSAAPIQLDHQCSGSVEAYVIEDALPVVALVGVRAPRLFIARQVLEALTPGEVRAAAAHELAHLRAWDNAKRLLLCWTPGLLASSAAGRRLESLWAAGAECAADGSAADSRARRLDLAGALVKVSRLAIAPAPGVRLFSTLHEHGDIADRVSHLLAPAPASGRSYRGGICVAAVVACCCAVVLLPDVLMAVHGFTEACLRLLP
jgi:Zn-dependent protease with chaperone function